MWVAAVAAVAAAAYLLVDDVARAGHNSTSNREATWGDSLSMIASLQPFHDSIHPIVRPSVRPSAAVAMQAKAGLSGDARAVAKYLDAQS